MTQPADDLGTPSSTGTAVADAFPTHNVGKPEVRRCRLSPSSTGA